MVPGAKFSMSTSAVSTRSSSAWRPASVFRSSTTLRLLELSITNSWDSIGSCERKRNGSPPGGSTLMTSAPSCANSSPQYGPL